MEKICTYFCPPQSPYVYLGHDRFVALTQKYAIQVELKPVDIGKIFSVSGGLPLPKRSPQRQAYRLTELARWRDFLNLPMQLTPKFFPVPADPAARLIIATQLAHGTQAALALTGAICRSVWANEENIANPDFLTALANAAGHDGLALQKSADTASVQAEYDRFTEEAMALNMFGAPWYVFNGESFWGQDRLDFLERAFARA
jgi:2-hydroxychromene-2-carboxylate isomerase